MSYRLTPLAEADIEAIGDYVREQSPAAAARLIERFTRHFDLLATQPHLGMARDDICPGIRHLVMGQYLALYWIEKRDVVIVRIIHGRRNITGDDVPSDD